MRSLLLLGGAWLLAAGVAVAQSKPTLNVLDWKAPTTLSTYLQQQVRAAYAPRAAELLQAGQSAAAAAAYRDSARARFRRLLGPLPARTPLRAQVTGVLKRPGLRIEKVIYESTPQHRVTANLYLPAGRGKKPAALLFCGHEPESKATVSYQKTALLLAQHGFVVLVIDPISQGERLQLTDATGKALARGGTTEHTLLNASATLLGSNTPAEEFWDNTRGLDYLLTRPEVDTARLGCLGNSGGATQAAYFMALEPRMKVAALCSYVASGEHNLELTGPSDGCVQLPGAGAARLDLADWPIMFAPKPLLVLAGRYDFVDFTQVEAATAETRRLYTALGKPNQFDLFAYDDGHGISQPKREAAVAWFCRWLAGSAAPVKEAALAVGTEKELRCTPTGQVATAYTNEISLGTQHLWQAKALATSRPTALPGEMAARVRHQLGLSLTKGALTLPLAAAERTDTVSRAGTVWQKIILRTPNEPPLPVLLALPTGHAAPTKLVLWLPDRGKTTVADSAALLATYRQQGVAVVLADLRGLGETADPGAALDRKYYNREYRPALVALHLGRPLLAQRVADVLLLLSWVQAETTLAPLPLELHATGRAALVALHAAVLTPQISQVHLSGLPTSFGQMLEHPAAPDVYSEVLPGVLRSYDVPDLQRALGARLQLP